MKLKPHAAGFASLLVPGLGQLLQGRVRATGVSLANAAMAAYTGTHWLADGEPLDFMCFIVSAAVHVFQALEAVEHGRR
ncbi:hypothetical protein [Candidatus Palauibacter soopunensis]|uniref:hypothetical protein n=1 Tax=Candidatus Palauibacter soopunensis TaxID=3056739 RepID=UPI002399B813|nr:hypothetical protein [Candidatus Palauibacter soopunensis]MDE2879349.1 hypothetical protein [Candidatus Palauibacter soopunensis]